MRKTKDNKRRRFLPANAESGQTIVMMAFLVIGMIGALGLAIDGGRLYFARRNTQNGVDAALMAATHALCTQRDPIKAGLEAAAASGLDNNDPDVVVTISNPPLQFIDTDEDIRYYVDVYITQTIEPYFIQFVYDGELMVTSSGVAFCVPPFDPATIPAVYASNSCGNGCGDDNATGSAAINWTGGNSTFYSPGDLFHSNGDILINGNSSSPSTLDGDISSACDIGLSGADMEEGSEAEESTPEQGDAPSPFTIEHFMPGGYFAERALAKEYDTNDDGITEGPDGLYFAITPETVAANPGVEPYSWYSNGTWVPNGHIEGLYYVDGDVKVQANKAEFYDVTAASGDTLGGGDNNLDWNGISIAATGEIAFTGGVGMVYYVDGIILFSGQVGNGSCSNAQGNVGVTASGESMFIGTMIAPYSGISFRGNDTTVVGAMWAQFIGMSGSSMTYEYDPSALPPQPPSVQMAR